MGNSVVYAIKIAFIVTITLTVVVALNALIGGLVSFSTNTPLGEIISLISVYLPFSANTVFGLLITSMVAILSFLVAKKLYEYLITAQEAA